MTRAINELGACWLLVYWIHPNRLTTVARPARMLEIRA